MKEFKGTKGNWIAEHGVKYQHGICSVIHAENGSIENIAETYGFYESETIANGNIIAAAPELLQELITIYQSITGGGNIVTFMEHDIARIETVLNKALGQ